MGLLKPLYEEFDKTYLAKLCQRLARLAFEKNDPLSLKVFAEAGEVLADHIVSLLKQTVSSMMFAFMYKNNNKTLK